MVVKTNFYRLLKPILGRFDSRRWKIAVGIRKSLSKLGWHLHETDVFGKCKTCGFQEDGEYI